MRDFRQALAGDQHLLFPPRLACLELLSELAGPPPASLLDIACGSAEYVAALSRRGYSAWGVESDPALHSAACRRHPELAGRLIQGDPLEVFDLVRGPLNLVYCLGGALAQLGSLEDVTETIAQMWDLAQPGGAVLLQLPCFEHLQAEARRALRLAQQHREAQVSEADGAFDQPVYVELLDSARHGESPQLASLSNTELRLYLPPLSATRAEGSRIELERGYSAAPSDWTADQLEGGFQIYHLRAPEGETAIELPLLALTRPRLERCVGEALARTHGQGAAVEWYGGFDKTDWGAQQGHSIVLIH
jgi:hypothetical protein